MRSGWKRSTSIVVSRRAQELECALEEDQVAAVVADDVLVEHPLGGDRLERRLHAADEDSGHGPRIPAATARAARTAELAQDPRRRPPDRQPVDRVGAVAQRPVADGPLDDLDRGVGQEPGHRRLDDPGDLVGRGDQRRAGASATATTGVTAKSLTGIQNRSSRPDDPDAGRVGIEATSSAASRSAVAAEVGVVRLGLAAREADLAAVVPVAAGALGQDDAGDAVVVRVEQDQDARPAGPARPGGGVRGGRSPRPPTRTGIRTSAGAGSDLGQVARGARGRRRNRIVERRS